MVFQNYYNMWKLYGITNLSEGIKITKSLLDKLDYQNDICDLIWAINAANQLDKSADTLSTTALKQIEKLAQQPDNILASHKCFFKYKGDNKVEKILKRAERHYKEEPRFLNRFKERQQKLIEVLSIS